MAVNAAETPDDRLNSTARRLSVVLILAALGPLVLWLMLKLAYQGITEPDAMDYGQLARNVLDGRGFVTSVIRPLTMPVSPNVSAQPDLTHPPLYAIVTAVLFGAFGAKDSTLALSSALFFLLTIPVVYVLALRLFGRRVALLSTLAYILGERMLGYALAGTPVTLATFLSTVLLLFLHKGHMANINPSSRGAGIGAAAASGILLGLCYLTEYTFAFALLPIAVYLALARTRRRVAVVAVFALTFFVTAGPWMVRNYRLTGDPVFGLRHYELVMMTQSYPAYSLYRVADARPMGELMGGMAKDVAKKCVAGVRALHTDLPALAGGWLMPFFIVGLLHAFRRRGADALRGAALGAIGCMALGSLLLRPGPEVLVPFEPFVVIMAMAYLVHLLNGMQVTGGVKGAVAAGVIAVVALPLAIGLATRASQPQTVQPATLRELAKYVTTSSTVVSDVPWAVAWYTGKTSVWLPKELGDFTKVDRTRRVDAIYLSPMLGRYAPSEGVQPWQLMQYQAMLQLQRQTKPTPIDLGGARFAVVGGWPAQNAVLLARTQGPVAEAPSR